MFGRHARHTESAGDVRCFPPIEFGHFNNFLSVKQRAVSQTYDKARLMLFTQPDERPRVQMVVMIVTDEY
jgi:hypothetical protein